GLAEDLGVPVIVAPEWSEDEHARDPSAGLTRLLEIAARSAEPAVVCSQGGVIPDLVRDLTTTTRREPLDVPSQKGSYWALFVDRGSSTSPTLSRADYYDDAV